MVSGIALFIMNSKISSLISRLKEALPRQANRLSQLRIQLIMPYVILTAITAGIGTFVITNYISSTIQERFSNLLFETSRIAGDEIVRLERQHLENLRLLVFTNGVPQTVDIGSSETLEELIFPVVANEAIEFASFVDMNGNEILSLISGEASQSYERSQGSNLSELEIVSLILEGTKDEFGDKFTSLERLIGSNYLLTAAPIKAEDGSLIGAVLIGSSLDNLVSELKNVSLADIVILDEQGALLGTTMAEPDQGFGILQLDATEINQMAASYEKNLAIFERDFRLHYSPFQARSSELGYLGIALPLNYILSTSFNSRILLTIIFSLTTLGVILIGSILANRLLRPISKLRDVTMEVAGGDLYKKTDLRRADEIGQLASVFDLMTARLRRRQREADRLYSVLENRTLELTDANSKLQNSQNQLVQSEKLSSIGQLIAGIIHDIKTPLGVITFASEELRDLVPKTSDADEYFRALHSGVDKVNTIISDLLKFARQSEAEKSVQDLMQTINVAIRLTQYERKSGKVELDTSNLPDEVLAFIDARQLEGVLINLFTNAIHAMPKGGILAIGVSEGEKIVIRIADSGSGIPEKILNKIFDPFFTTKPEGQGTGLGLSVAYGIINDHGGHIEVDSEVGLGTEFIISLPRPPQHLRTQYREQFPKQSSNGNLPHGNGVSKESVSLGLDEISLE
jgi:signal transduction histidine kinase